MTAPPSSRRITAVHDYGHLNEMLRLENPGRPPLSVQARAEHPPVLRPLVAEHPTTGLESLCAPGGLCADAARAAHSFPGGENTNAVCFYYF